MEKNKNYDVIIAGGSYAGLSAAMCLGRSLRNILVIDSSKPCNRQTPQSHNLITHDGSTPAEITAKAKEQVLKYDTVSFYEGVAMMGEEVTDGYKISTGDGHVFAAKQLIFATGVKDVMPEIKGFQECWGISILHCPYCHGYEVKMVETGIFANGDMGYAKVQMISNWTDKLTVFTNGKQAFSEEQLAKLQQHNIGIIEKEVGSINHEKGYVQSISFTDGTMQELQAIYAAPDTVQHCTIPQQLGCEVDENGLLTVDDMQKTTVDGVYACGDNANWFRTVALSISAGITAGAALNREMILASF